MVSKCDLCNKSFARQKELGRHVRIVHENQRHECGICHQLFTRKYTLTKHKKLHDKVINGNIGQSIITKMNLANSNTQLQ